MNSKKRSWFHNCRISKNCRLTVIGILILIVLFLLWSGSKFKALLIGLLIVLAGAFWLELYNYDIDLGRLIQTGSLSGSRVETVTVGGKSVRLIGECVTDNLNCADFKTQEEAQAMYQKCLEQIKTENPDITDPNALDVYGLDRDHDGIVCEHLPKAAAY